MASFQNMKAVLGDILSPLSDATDLSRRTSRSARSSPAYDFSTAERNLDEKENLCEQGGDNKDNRRNTIDAAMLWDSSSSHSDVVKGSEYERRQTVDPMIIDSLLDTSCNDDTICNDKNDDIELYNKSLNDTYRSSKRTYSTR